MKLKKHLPEFSIGFNNPSAIEQEALVDLLRKYGVCIYAGTEFPDDEYPYIYWTGTKIVQTKYGTGKYKTVSTISEFASYFLESSTQELELNENYKAVINYETKTVVVNGGMTIPFEKILELEKLINQ
jgi:signal recognition particle subunit SEC65